MADRADKADRANWADKADMANSRVILPTIAYIDDDDDAHEKLQILHRLVLDSMH